MRGRESGRVSEWMSERERKGGRSGVNDMKREAQLVVQLVERNLKAVSR